MDAILHLTETGFDRLILRSPQPVVVDFWAPWCAPCEILSAALDEVAPEKAGDILFAKVNVDRFPALAARYGIRSIPALVRFERAAPTDMLLGSRSADELRVWLCSSRPAA